MAAGGPVQDLCDEASCSICLDYFKDPVTITECGHNFCQTCITQYWGEDDQEASCPQCRKIIQPRNFIPNQQLANFVKIAKEFTNHGTAKGQEEKSDICEEHQEPLKFICKQDEAFLCVICNRSEQHRYHRAISLKKASKGYKDYIGSCLDALRKKREKILVYKVDTEKESQYLLKQTEAEREKAVAEFRQLYRFLEEQEEILMAQMEEVEKEIITKGEEHLARLSEELSSLECLILEMEKKYQQPATELLQDVKSILKRYEEREKFVNPVAFPPALKWRIWQFCDLNPFLEGIRKQFKDTLSGDWLQKANITLDPDTAYPDLTLSEDRKSVIWEDNDQDVPDNPQRFDKWPFVLGREGFTAGRHSWEITVGSENEWAVGVARRSVRRKGQLTISPEEGIWAVGKWADTYKALNPPHFSPLSVSGELKTVRVSLSCAGGWVAFFDAETAAQLFAFAAVPFSGETLHPFFWLQKKGHLTIST